MGRSLYSCKSYFTEKFIKHVGTTFEIVVGVDRLKKFTPYTPKLSADTPLINPATPDSDHEIDPLPPSPPVQASPIQVPPAQVLPVQVPPVQVNPAPSVPVPKKRGHPKKIISPNAVSNPPTRTLTRAINLSRAS